MNPLLLQDARFAAFRPELALWIDGFAELGRTFAKAAEVLASWGMDQPEGHQVAADGSEIGG